VNTARTSGTDSSGKTVSDKGSTTVVGSTPSPSLIITKSSTTDRFYQAGQVIPYLFEVTNTGDITVEDIVVTDSLLASPPTCASTVLAPGQKTTCTGSYTVVTGDLTGAWIVNTAGVTGEPKRGTLPPTPPSTVQIPKTDPPALRIVKAATPVTYDSVGDTISYTLTVSNTGGSSVTNVTVTDPQVSGLSCSVGLPATLLPSTSITCTGTYIIRQQDIDSGLVPNTATVDGKQGATDLRDRSSKTVVGPDVSPELSITKKALTKRYSVVGDAISYEFLVRNEGDVTISGIEVLDAVLDAPGAVCPKTSLGPGKSMTCTGQHTVTNRDLALSAIMNSASVTGIPPRGEMPPSTPSTVVVPKEGADAAADLAITKTGDATALVDDRIEFTLSVTNKGPDTALAVVVRDPMPLGLTALSASGSGWTCAVSQTLVQCSRASLASGDEAPPISIRVRVSAEARPRVTNAAVVTSIARDPKPDNNVSQVIVKVDRAPQTPVRKTKIRKSTNTLIITPGKTNTGQKMTVEVTCTERLGRSTGRATSDLCVVSNKPDGSVVVKVTRTRPVSVQILSTAPASRDFKPYSTIQVLPMGAPLPHTL
jgi:uncharacterized repeat protein (TIGR01451 family)